MAVLEVRNSIPCDRSWISMKKALILSICKTVTSPTQPIFDCLAEQM